MSLLGNPLLADAQTACALLDPAAVCCLGSTLSVTVPAGETWWLTNAWYLEAPGDSAHIHCHRELCASHAVPLPAGYTIKKGGVTSSGGPSGNAVWCDPSLATQHADPEAKLAERLNRIATLPRRSLMANAPAGSPVNTAVTLALPPEVQRYLVVAVVIEDVAWTILRHTTAPNGTNTTRELDDVRSLRNSARMLFATTRDRFDRIRICGASPSGTGNSVVGQGGIIYIDLTNVADW